MIIPQTYHFSNFWLEYQNPTQVYVNYFQSMMESIFDEAIYRSPNLTFNY